MPCNPKWQRAILAIQTPTVKVIFNNIPSGTELIDGCRQGRHQDQCKLYQWLAPQMLALCRRYIADASEAEAVMVKGFLKVFDKIDQYRGSGSFVGWVRRIMVNESLSYIRQHKNLYLEADVELADTQPDYNHASQQLDADDLLAMIDRLPSGYRTVFNLYAIEGYSHREIADLLDISVSTSKSQLNRARKLLQKQLLERQQAFDRQTAEP